LPTPPHDDAVTVDYRPESVYLVRTYTTLFMYAHRRTIPAFAGMTKKGLSGQTLLIHRIIFCNHRTNILI
ncbi:MAG: hypothetical protein P9X24_01510, partial [Candidatus Hatepunaea meridiana]|nr:hypothetical protein [Candidatus Hatepunaea meridiana]